MWSEFCLCVDPIYLFPVPTHNMPEDQCSHCCNVSAVQMKYSTSGVF